MYPLLCITLNMVCTYVLENSTIALKPVFYLLKPEIIKKSNYQEKTLTVIILAVGIFVLHIF